MGAVTDALIAAREASQELARIEREGQIMRDAIGVQGHDYEVHAKSGILDPARKIVALIEWEDQCPDTEPLQDAVAEGREIIDGAAQVADTLTVEVLQRYYLRGQGYNRIARDLAWRMPDLQRMPEELRPKVLQKSMQAVVRDLDGMGEAKLRALARR